MFKITLTTIALVFITLAGALSFAQDTPYQQQLPPIRQTTCSAPALLQGQAAVNVLIDEINEAGRIFGTVDGGCGFIEISAEQLSRLPAILLADVSDVHSAAKCSAKSSAQLDEPFGNRAEVTCTKMIESPDGTESFRGYLITGVIIDTDGEVAVYFVSARD